MAEKIDLALGSQAKKVSNSTRKKDFCFAFAANERQWLRDLLPFSRQGSEELIFFGSHTFGKIETNGRWHWHMMDKLQPG